MADELRFEVDEPMKEMLEYLTGRRPESETELKSLLGGAKVTVEFLNLMCLTGYATLFALARRGDRRASQYLVDRLMGVPDRPFAQEVQALDALSSAKLLYRELLRAGQSPLEAQANVQRLAHKALAATGQQLRQEDLEE